MDPEDVGFIKSELQSHGKQLERLIHSIEGNGTPGLKTRLDRLEQIEKRRRHYIGLAIGAAGTSIATAAATIWTGLRAKFGL